MIVAFKLALGRLLLQQRARNTEPKSLCALAYLEVQSNYGPVINGTYNPFVTVLRG